MSNFIPLPPTYAVSDPQVRAILDVLSRNMQVVIEAAPAVSTSTSIGGASTFGSPSSNTNITNIGAAYTLDTLTADLKRGAAEVISGALNGTTVMKLEPAGQYVVFQHKDAIVLGNTGAYSGVVRTALGLTSTGILGGYNDKNTGAWQTTFAIESSTGNLTLLGTIRANSVISVDAYLGSSTVQGVLNDISSANANAIAAFNAVSNKLSKNASDILSGTIDFSSYGGFKTSGMTVYSDGSSAGQGVAFTSKGIVGRNSSGTTFTLDSTTGAATFSGNITGGANINITGYGIFEGFSGSGQNTSAIIANAGGGAFTGVTAYSTSGYVFGGAIKGFSNSTTGGFALDNGGNAVVGWQNNPTYGVGVLGFAAGAQATAVRGVGGKVGVVGQGTTGVEGTGNYESGSVGGRFDTSYPGGYAVQIVGGLFRYGATTIQPPPNSNTYFLAGDGVWYSLSTVTSGVSSFNSRTGAVSLSSADVTGALGYTPPSSAVSSFNGRGGDVSLTATDLVNTSPSAGYFLSGVGWIPVTVVNTLNGANGNVTNSFAATVSYPSVGFNVSGSGTNSVTYNIYQTSDRSLKRDIQNSDRGLEFVKRLTPRSYYWNSEYMPFDKRTYGLIADEVLAACDGEETSLAYTNYAGVMAGKMAVDYTSMVPVLIKAIQELSAKVQTLEAR